MTTPERTCHACDQPPTGVHHRDATAEETAAYHRGMDQWRAAEGLPPMPEDAAIRRAQATVTVLHCDDHGPHTTS